MSNLGNLPTRITSGETIWVSADNTVGATNADIIIPSFLPASYALAYRFAAPTPITVTAAANGANTGWTLEVTAAQTLAWKPGVVRYAGMATHSASGRVYTVDDGAIAVSPSPLATSSWTAVVTACDAAILEYAATPHGSLSADGLSFSFRSLDDLVNLRAYARTMADSETGARMPRIIRTRFP